MANMRTVILPIFFIWLCIRLGIVIINLLLIRRKAKSLGKMICHLPNLTASTLQRKLFSVMLSSCMLVILLCLLLPRFLTKDLLYMTGVVLPLEIILRGVLLKKISAKNGFYENGFVVGMFMRYDRIHSYQILDTGELTLFMKNGLTLNLTVQEESDKMAINNFLTYILCIPGRANK